MSRLVPGGAGGSAGRGARPPPPPRGRHVLCPRLVRRGGKMASVALPGEAGALPRAENGASRRSRALVGRGPPAARGGGRGWAGPGPAPRVFAPGVRGARGALLWEGTGPRTARPRRPGAFGVPAPSAPASRSVASPWLRSPDASV